MFVKLRARKPRAKLAADEAMSASGPGMANKLTRRVCECDESYVQLLR